MLRLLTLLTTFLLSLPSFAQKNREIPAFGKIEKADLEMKECDFDKDAEAVVLFDIANIPLNSRVIM
jgi:hypothetical protein